MNIYISCGNLGRLQFVLKMPEEVREMLQRTLVGLQRVLRPSHDQCMRLENVIKSINRDEGTNSPSYLVLSLKGPMPVENNAASEMKPNGKYAYTPKVSPIAHIQDGMFNSSLTP